MPTLHANPYDLDHTGFFFDSAENYTDHADNHPCEEFEIEFIDGNDEELALFQSLDINQATLEDYFDALDLDPHQQVAFAYLVENCGYTLDDARQKIDELIIFEGSAEDCCWEHLNDSGLLSEIPEALQGYFDLDAYARDAELNGDITAFRYARTEYTVSGHC